jgi:hypothetical protein
MDSLRFVAERDNERFEIIHGAHGEGLYVYRYVDGVSTYDYLQDNLPMAYLCAQEEWGVPPSAWREAYKDELPCCRSEKRTTSD